MLWAKKITFFRLGDDAVGLVSEAPRPKKTRQENAPTRTHPRRNTPGGKKRTRFDARSTPATSRPPALGQPAFFSALLAPRKGRLPKATGDDSRLKSPTVEGRSHPSTAHTSHPVGRLTRAFESSTPPSRGLSIDVAFFTVVRRPQATLFHFFFKSPMRNYPHGMRKRNAKLHTVRNSNSPHRKSKTRTQQS